MSTADLLGRIVAALDGAAIPHMIAGSFASTHHGAPRATQDIDIVIDPTPQALDSFVASLPPSQYYVDADVARDAVTRRSQFNVIDLATMWKIDLVIRKARPFSLEEFRRRERVVLLGTRTSVATAEDTIVAKLEWAKLGDSERQLRDVAGILTVRAGNLDLAYIERWVADLDLAAQWARVRP